MNLPIEVIGSVGSVAGIVLIAIYKFMRGVADDTTERIETYESEATKKLEETQAVVKHLQGQVVEIQADNNKLLRQMLDMQTRDTAREKELGEAKAQTLTAKAGEAQAKHLQADAEKERDTALVAKKEALELVEIQSKALQEANATLAEMRKQLHEANLEIVVWKAKYEGAQEMGGKVRVEVTLPASPNPDPFPIAMGQGRQEENKETTLS